MWTSSRSSPFPSSVFRRNSAERRPQTSHSPARQKYAWDDVIRSQRHRAHLANFAKDTSPSRIEVPKLMLKQAKTPRLGTIDFNFDLKSRVMKDLEISSARDSKFRNLREEMFIDLNKLEEMKLATSATSERLQNEAALSVRVLTSLKDKCSKLNIKLKDIKPKVPPHHTRAKEFFKHVKTGRINELKRLLHAFPKLVSQIDSTEKTVLHWAALRDDPELIKILLAFKADVLAKDIVSCKEGWEDAA
mmetsp:Transcript_25578/g.44622  ORF Transcript_25578/g.44622 Transcript_25578/m.44622 type:complete len:247 (-) Transcript_25578:1418-2158(-)